LLLISNWLRSFMLAPHGVPTVKAALKFSGRTRTRCVRRPDAERFPPQFRSSQSGFVFACLRHTGFPW